MIESLLSRCVLFFLAHTHVHTHICTLFHSFSSSYQHYRILHTPSVCQSVTFILTSSRCMWYSVCVIQCLWYSVCVIQCLWIPVRGNVFVNGSTSWRLVFFCLNSFFLFGNRFTRITQGWICMRLPLKGCNQCEFQEACVIDRFKVHIKILNSHLIVPNIALYIIVMWCTFILGVIPRMLYPIFPGGQIYSDKIRSSG